MPFRTLVTVGVLLSATSALAQTATVSYDLNIYPAGVTVPNTRVVPATAVTCDLATRPADTTENSTNPTTWWWDDPVRAGAFCRIDDTARLTALPPGTYAVAVVSVDAAGVKAAESVPRYSFTRAAPSPLPRPRAVTGARVSK